MIYSGNNSPSSRIYMIAPIPTKKILTNVMNNISDSGIGSDVKS